MHATGKVVEDEEKGGSLFSFGAFAFTSSKNSSGTLASQLLPSNDMDRDDNKLTAELVGLAGQLSNRVKTHFVLSAFVVRTFHGKSTSWKPTLFR